MGRERENISINDMMFCIFNRALMTVPPSENRRKASFVRFSHLQPSSPLIFASDLDISVLNVTSTRFNSHRIPITKRFLPQHHSYSEHDWQSVLVLEIRGSPSTSKKANPSFVARLIVLFASQFCAR